MSERTLTQKELDFSYSLGLDRAPCCSWFPTYGRVFFSGCVPANRSCADVLLPATLLNGGQAISIPQSTRFRLETIGPVRAIQSQH